ncbi:MAG: pyrroline-5-carboxylate reductase [Chitinophagaceae bacterium]|nr:MAG: pyrroline-5-carboxylate reductase [Chitinophagaceae bacterium]
MMKAAIIGAGNIGKALAQGLVESGSALPADITLTRRNGAALEAYASEGYAVHTNNRRAIEGADVVFLCILPQQLDAVLDEIAPALDPQKQLIVSVVTGAHSSDLRKHLGAEARIIRAMPNTALRVKASMTCLAASGATEEDLRFIQSLFGTMGSSIVINEELMSAATALCACGIAFFLRSIRAAAQGGVEIGFHAHDAITIAAQTALGAAQLLLVNGTHPEEEIDKVTSPKGCTIAGLNEMEHQGLSSALIKGIKLSASIAGELYKK